MKKEQQKCCSVFFFDIHFAIFSAPLMTLGNSNKAKEDTKNDNVECYYESNLWLDGYG